MDRNRKRRLQLLAGLQVLAAAAITALILYLLSRYVQYGERAARETATAYGERAARESETACGEQAAQETGTAASEGNVTAIPDTIRVRILTDGFTGECHDRVKVTSEKAFAVELDGKKIKEGKNCSVSVSELEEGQRMKLSQKDGAGLTVASLKRAEGHPQYSGTLWLYREAGGIALVNELPLEEYLCAVVSSEMPSDYPMEAQKAQAVCARTYACNCIRNARGEESRGDVPEGAREGTPGSEGESSAADLDDGVSYQVYNNYRATEISSRAVEDTTGEILPLDELLYYSTSCLSEHREDLDNDEAFREFLLQEPDAGAEYDSPWLRWEAELPAQDILGKLAERYGWQAERIDGIRVAKREGNGQVSELEFRCGESVRMVSGEYAIRQVLSPAQATLRLRDGEEHAGMQSLPSAFFWIETICEKTERPEDGQSRESEGCGSEEGEDAGEPAGMDAAGSVEAVRIYGGGYGHGIGMSQYGAAAMAKKGLDYREILEYYYDTGVISQASRRDCDAKPVL